MFHICTLVTDFIKVGVAALTRALLELNGGFNL